MICLSCQSRRDTGLAYLAGRLIKLLANSLRPFFYLHHWLLPSQRFCLKNTKPKAIIRPRIPAGISESSRLIPKIIWQTNYTNKVTLPLKTASYWNRYLSTGYEYRFHATSERLDFIKQHFPGRITEFYDRLTIGAAQADLWRLLVLYKHGGIYMDIDAHLVWPLNRIISSGTPEIFLRYKDGAATNYFIASRPDNPIIKALIDEVLHRIENSQSSNIYEITGPAVFQAVLSKYEHHWRFSQHTCLQGNFSNKYFQYIDKPEGHWTIEQKSHRAISP
jgi:mannosyltransferase OCH1-like enzyme